MKTGNKAFVWIAVIGAFILGYAIFSLGSSSRGPEAPAGTGAAATPAAAPVADMTDLIGRPAPDFALKDGSGAVRSLSGMRGKAVVLFFNEGLMCYPACWDQMAKLSADQRLNAAGVESYSVVIDAPANWGYAVSRMPALASAKVLYDVDGSVSRAYAMLTARSSMHYGAYPGHTYVVIDPQGIVRYVYDDPRMAINNDKVATELAALASGK